MQEVRQMFPLDWQENSIADGEFTVPDDREVVVQLGKRAVTSGWDLTPGNLQTLGKLLEDVEKLTPYCPIVQILHPLSNGKLLL